MTKGVPKPPGRPPGSPNLRSRKLRGVRARETPPEPEPQLCPTCGHERKLYVVCECRARRVMTPACPDCAAIQRERMEQALAAYSGVPKDEGIAVGRRAKELDD